MSVLDCGSGTGAFALALAKTAKPPVKLHMVDLSEAMLEQAKQNLILAGIRADCQQADITELPFSEAQFDIVIAAHVLEHVTDPMIAIREMHRVLKPGGKIVLCVTRESLFGRYVQLKWRTH